ncbi:MAG: zinc-dependent metalloprotease [Bacteroidetes bacterium]|nr:zinc-dependent metalloprotease [Bacteroidota bacterium]
MKNTTQVFLALFFLLFSLKLTAQNNFWREIADAQAKAANQLRPIVPERYKVFALDTTGLLATLKTAPAEFSVASKITPLVIALPMPDGSIQHFNVVEYSMMEPGLQDKFPDIRTYSGQGIEDRTATIKLDWTAFGFHAMILSPVHGSAWIDPYARGEKTNYIAYYKKDLTPKRFNEIGVEDYGLLSKDNGTSIDNSVPVGGPCLGSTLRTYRLAVACTGEYAVAVGGTNAALLHSAIVTSVNRVNGVYETEVAIRLVLIANNNVIEYLNAATDPFTGNNNANTLINESQTVINGNIGAANYDIGHTFSTGGGGLAGLGVVCTAAQKARGITGSPAPVGDAYDIDYVAHEMGHQFGGNHTFNAATGNCSGNGANTANAEPGSGSTIMAYAGICTTNDLQPHSDPQFHAVSFNELGKFSRNAGGSTCGTATATGNTPPVVNAGSNFTIPVNTPFTLTGSATDADGDMLTYSWEQIDVGAAFGNWNVTTGAATPLFRSFQPVLSPSRTFPRMYDIANNVTTIGEILPTVARTMNFRLTARDNRAGGGGVCYDEMSVTTSGATAFKVTSQPTATTWVANGTNTATITWTNAGTTAAPFNVANVSILFSTDGGLTFPYTLVSSTANDGTENIIIPAQSTTKGRVMVKSIGNIFFSINTGDITISSACTAEGAVVAPTNTVVALAGSPALNLGLSPQYSTPLTIAGTLTTSDPTSSLAIFYTVTSACQGFSNVVRYQVFNFTPNISATYTFNLTGTLGTVMNLYSGSYDPSNPCAGFLKSNISYDGTSPTASSSYSVALTAGTAYSMAITTFTTTQPALPSAYSVAVSSASPAGGQLFTGSTIYSDPGASFSYAYVIVNTATNIITGISATANLTNSATYPSGTYNVYGVSYSSSIPLNAFAAAYVGGSLNTLVTNIFNNPATFCVNFSKNFVTVIVTAPLAVNDLVLSARKEGTKGLLSWKTTSETNSAFFNVQRSGDGVHFSSTLGAVTAAGNSNSLRNYGFTDAAPLSKWNYYRVEEVDINGSKTISNVVALLFDKNGIIIVYPNPTAGQLNIDYNSETTGSLKVQVYDSKGALVKDQLILVETGRNVNTLDVSKLAAGVYLLKYIEPGGTSSAMKFIKK